MFANTNEAAINLVNSDLYLVSPLLGPLQNNGGPTFTHALLTGSPAIDSAESGGLLTDQRGAQRLLAPDIGAYEVAAPVTPPDLQILLSDFTHVMVSWPSSPGPVVLQQKAVMGGGVWSDVSELPAYDSTVARIVLSIDAGNRFYRLRSP